MLRSSFIAASAVILCCATATGQQQLSAYKMLGPVKDAGIYHVGTGTWTRGSGAKANLGPDIIFRSDVSSGYFGTGWEGNPGIDEGILPGTGNSNQTGNAGPQDAYTVDGAEFGYCSLSTAWTNWDFAFYDSYVPCDLPASPGNCVNLAGSLPTIALPAGGFCWMGVFDFGVYEVCLEADGGPCAPGYDGGGLGLDGFGWAATWATTDAAVTGPFLDGHDLTWTPEGEGTVYQPAFSNSCGMPVSSALGTEDFFAVDVGGPLGAGCYWFGGYVNNNGCGAASNNPGGQFHLTCFTDATATCSGSDCNTVFCDTNADNQGSLTLSTCDCSGGSIMLSLSTSFVNQFTYPVVGLGTGSAQPTGVSDLCLIGSTIGRYAKDAGAIDGNGNYSIDLLNAASAPGGGVPTIGGALCNGNTWRFQSWHRDGMNPSRFSQGTSGTIQ